MKTASSPAVDPADDPVVSVVIPTFNRASLLPRTLESVLAQTFGAFEILVVDDGSEDDTAEVVVRMADPRIRYLAMPENRGVAAARNHGLAEARGEFIAFLDSDDEWFPEKLERQVACFRDGPPELGLVYTGVQDLHERGERRIQRPTHRGDLYETLLLGNVVHGGGSNVMIRRTVVDVVGGFDETLPAIEDFDYWLRIARHFTLDFVSDVLLTYHDPLERDERKSLNLEENLAAREAFYRKHQAAMRKAGVAHRFLLETARRTHEALPADRWRCQRLVLRVVALRPFWGRPWRLLAATTLPEFVLQPIRRLRSTTTKR